MYIAITVYFKYDFFLLFLYILTPLYTILYKKILFEFFYRGRAPGAPL